MLGMLERFSISHSRICCSLLQVAERAAASGRFRRAFVKLGGIDWLIKLLKNGPDADAIRAIARALAELLKEPEAQQVWSVVIMSLPCHCHLKLYTYCQLTAGCSQLFCLTAQHLQGVMVFML